MRTSSLLMVLVLVFSVLVEVQAAKVFSYECQASLFTSATQPVGLCTAVNAVLATPESAAENADALSKITVANRATLGAVPTYSASLNMITWSYTGTPRHKEIFWVQPNKATAAGGYALDGMYTNWWSGSNPTADYNVKRYLTMHSTLGVWYDDNYDNAKCALCQKEACATACHPEGTTTATGTWWPSCTCTCKAGWKGVACNRQIEVYPLTGVTTTAQLLAFCASKGGFIAQPKSREEEDAILRVVPAAVAGGTDYTKNVAIGAMATTAAYSYCFHDGPRNGECVVKDAAFVAGQYSDYGGVPPGSPMAAPIVILFPLSYASGRWYTDAVSNVFQVACQFIACDQICDATHTQQALGAYPSCTCQCKSGWRGPLCKTTATMSMTVTNSHSQTSSPTISVLSTTTNTLSAASPTWTSEPTTTALNTPSYTSTESSLHSPTISRTSSSQPSQSASTHQSPSNGYSSSPTHTSTHTAPTPSSSLATTATLSHIYTKQRHINNDRDTSPYQHPNNNLYNPITKSNHFSYIKN